MSASTLTGWRRMDGRMGIRNVVLVAYLVECAHHVCSRIARSFDEGEVQVIGFSGCFPSDYGQQMMEALCTHPNVGAVQLVSLGCENFARAQLAEAIRASGRPVNLTVIQQAGGTAAAIEQGHAFVAAQIGALRAAPKSALSPSDLVIGTVCGGSDGTSGCTGNPAAGVAFDLLTEAGASCIFEETGELIGCEHIMAERAETPDLGRAIIATVEKAARYYAAMGYGSFSNGNADRKSVV